MEDIVRNFLGLIFLVGADIIVVAVFVALIIANYLACKSAFDYLGYDTLPLGKEAFIGQIIGPFFPEATLSHFYAFVVACVIAMGLFLLINRLFHIYQLLKDRKEYQAQNDTKSAQIILNQIYRDIAVIIALLPFLIAALNWDLHLFLYRCVVGALGIEDPSQAPMVVENWANQREKYGQYFAWALASIGAFGYLGVTGVSCIALEVAFRRSTERLMVLIANIEEIFISTDQQDERTLYGYDSQRQPVYDPAVPVAYDASSNPVRFYGYDSEGFPVYDPQTRLTYGTDGNPILLATGPEAGTTSGDRAATSSREHHQQEEIRTQKAPPNTNRQTNSESPQAQDTAGPKDTERAESGTPNAGLATPISSNNSQTSLFDDEETFQSLGSRRSENSQTKEVIGKPGGRISLAGAMADKERYWVDPDTLSIWDLNYRKSLFPETF